MSDDEKLERWGYSIMPLVASEVKRRAVLRLPAMDDDEAQAFLDKAREVCERAAEGGELVIPAKPKTMRYYVHAEELRGMVSDEAIERWRIGDGPLCEVPTRGTDNAAGQPQKGASDDEEG